MQCFGKMCQMWLLYSTTNCGNLTSKILSWKQIIDEYKHSGIQYCMYIIYTIYYTVILRKLSLNDILSTHHPEMFPNK